MALVDAVDMLSMLLMTIDTVDGKRREGVGRVDLAGVILLFS